MACSQIHLGELPPICETMAPKVAPITTWFVPGRHALEMVAGNRPLPDATAASSPTRTALVATRPVEMRRMSRILPFLRPSCLRLRWHEACVLAVVKGEHPEEQ